jgi:hypothetical protein
MIKGIHIPLINITVGTPPTVVVCHRCWSEHDEVYLSLDLETVGWSCCSDTERTAYAEAFRQYVPDPVPAANHINREVLRWFGEKPDITSMSPEERAAYLLYRMGAIPRAAIPHCGVTPRPAALGSVGDRVEAEVECLSVTQQPATQWGESFLIVFRCQGHTLHWRASTGGLDAQPGGKYKAKFTIKSFETFGGDPIIYVNRVQAADYKVRRREG